MHALSSDRDVVARFDYKRLKTVKDVYNYAVADILVTRCLCHVKYFANSN